MVGSNEEGSTVSNCQNAGTIQSISTIRNAGRMIGGVVGANKGGRVQNCTNSGTVDGKRSIIGGVVGENSGIVADCQNTGIVKGNSYVGGVVGHNAAYPPQIGTVTGCNGPKGLVERAKRDIGKELKPGHIIGENNGDAYDNSSNTYFAGGGGTSDSPYEIANAQQLLLLAGVINQYAYDDGDQAFGVGDRKVVFTQEAHAYDYLKKAYYKLTADIKLNDTSSWENWGESKPKNSWKPIGTSDKPFMGAFDGGSRTISGLYFKDKTDSVWNGTNGGLNVGLFGVVGGCKIENFTLADSFVSGKDNVGSVAGTIRSGTVNGITCGGTVSGNSNVGGIAGVNAGTVESCNSPKGLVRNAMGDVGSDDKDMGHIIGHNTGAESNNSSDGINMGVELSPLDWICTTIGGEKKFIVSDQAKLMLINSDDFASFSPATNTVNIKDGTTAGRAYAVKAVSTTDPTKFSIATVLIRSASAECNIVSVINPSDATVKSLEITANLPSGTSSTPVEVTVSDGATWELYSDEQCVSKIEDEEMPLAAGKNTAYIKVTAEDGTSSQVYTLTFTVAVPPSPNIPKDNSRTIIVDKVPTPVVETTKNGQFTSNTIELTAEKAMRITTAVIIEPEGKRHHVPTYVYERNGKWYAIISSLTDSEYELIYNEVSFSDAIDQWYKAAVNEMGSRTVIEGVGDNLCAGERGITRAEFAAIVVRALGIIPGGEPVFTDVGAAAWYAGAVAKAYEYGIVVGVGEGLFAPERNISREEAMLMANRAAKIVGLNGDISDLKPFPDAENVSVWAQGAAAWNVGSGIIVGSNGMLRPKENISRAETAAVVLRLLQKSGLVDVR